MLLILKLLARDIILTNHSGWSQQLYRQRSCLDSSEKRNLAKRRCSYAAPIAATESTLETSETIAAALLVKRLVLVAAPARIHCSAHSDDKSGSGGLLLEEIPVILSSITTVATEQASSTGGTRTHRNVD
jgi:hypothetical protein